MATISFRPHAAILPALLVATSAVVAAACRARQDAGGDASNANAYTPTATALRAAIDGAGSAVPPLSTSAALPPLTTIADSSTARSGAAAGPDRCADLLRSPRATPMAVVDARFHGSDDAGPAAPTPGRLVHLRYTFDSQSEQALATYLRQWHDAIAPIDASAFAALSPAEQAVYRVFAAPLPVRRPASGEVISDGVDPGAPPPSRYTILPTTMYVACADRLYDPVADRWPDPLETSPDPLTAYVVLGDFRPPPPAGAGTTLYLSDEESLAIHHLLGSTPVYAPPLGALNIPGVGYPDDSTRLEWLRRAIPIARTFSGALQLVTMPAINAITLDRALDHAVVSVRFDGSSSGLFGLVKTPGSDKDVPGGLWTVEASFGGGVE